MAQSIDKNAAHVFAFARRQFAASHRADMISQIADVEDSQELGAEEWAMVNTESRAALAQGSEQSAGDGSGLVPPLSSADTLTPALAPETTTASSEAAATAAFDGGPRDSCSGRAGISEGMVQQLTRQEPGSGCTLVKV